MKTSPKKAAKKSAKPFGNPHARVTPDQAKALIMQTPAANWDNTVDDKQAVLTYQFNYASAKGQEERIKRLIGENPVLNFSSQMSGKMLIAQAAVNTRIESIGESIFGPDFVVITEKRGGFLFGDKKSKTYLHVGKEQKVKTYFPERFTATTSVSSNKKEAVIETSVPYKLKYKLQLDSNQKWKPFARDVIATSIGCPDLFAAAGIDLEPIIKTGVPVKGEVFMLSNKGEWESMTSFSLSDLSVASGRSKLFDVPHGYKNLRELVNLPKPPKAPKITLAEITLPLQKPVYTHPTPFTATGMPGTARNEVVYDREISQIPSCFPETYGAKISDLIDEKLLDDVKFLVNAASKRLTGFSGNNGTLKMDWLNQVQTQANSLAPGSPGTGLFTLLHWEGTGTQNLGFLDLLAVKTLGSLLAQGNNLNDIGLSPADQATVNNLIANTGITPQNRFSSLSATDQHSLVKSYVFNKIGTIDLTYPSTTGTQSVAWGMLDYRIDDISFDIQINNTAIIDTLQFDNNGVHLIVDLPDASGSAAFSAWVTDTYWTAVAVAALACVFSFGAACTVAPILVAVGVFVTLTSGDISIDLKNLVIDSHITMIPNAVQVLEPEVNLTLSATVHCSYTPNVSVGVNNLLGDIATTVANNTNLVINAIQSQLKNKLNSYLQNDLKITYPPQFGPVTLSGLGAPVTDFRALDLGYVEQNLNAGSLSIIDPYITQIDSNVEPNIILLRTQFEQQFTDPETALQALNGNLLSWSTADFTNIARYYAGTVLSQNFINYYIYTLWRDGNFNFNFSAAQTKALYKMVLAAFPPGAFPPYQQSLAAHLWFSVPPRTLFTPEPASLGEYYATTFFDDVRLCFELPNSKVAVAVLPPQALVEFIFAGQAFTEIGFGGLDASINKLNLLKASDRVFDIYFDNKQDVQINDPEVQSFTVPNMQPSVNFDYSPLTSLQTLFADALRLSLVSRNAAVIPRGTGDPKYIQRYALGSNNAFGSKNNGNPLAAVFQLVPFRGNLYVSQGLSGIATGIFEGTNALDADTMTSITAELILTFQ